MNTAAECLFLKFKQNMIYIIQGSWRARSREVGTRKVATEGSTENHGQR